MILDRPRVDVTRIRGSIRFLALLSRLDLCQPSTDMGPTKTNMMTVLYSLRLKAIGLRTRVVTSYISPSEFLRSFRNGEILFATGTGSRWDRERGSDSNDGYESYTTVIVFYG